MEGNSWRPDPAAVDSSSGGGDWRQQLLPEARQRIVNKIMDNLKRHLPISAPDGHSELKKIAVRFEEKIYTAATNQSDYLRKISLKMLSMEPKTQDTAAINPSLSNPVVGNPNPSETGSKILEQTLRDHLHGQREELKQLQMKQAQQLLQMQQMQQKQQLKQMQTIQEQQLLQMQQMQEQRLLQMQQKQQMLHQSLMQQQLYQQNHQQTAPMPVNPLTQLHQMNARQAFGTGLYRQDFRGGQSHNYYQPQKPGTLFPISSPQNLQTSPSQISQSSSLTGQHNLSSSHPTTGMPLLSANSPFGVPPFTYIAPSPIPGDIEKQSGTSRLKTSEKPRNVPQPQIIQGENVAAFKIRVAALQNRVTALEMRVWIVLWILVFVVFEFLFSNVMLK